MTTPSPSSAPRSRVSRVLAFLPAYLIAFCFVANGALTGMFAGARCSGQSMRSLAAGAACVRAHTHEAAAWAVAGASWSPPETSRPTPKPSPKAGPSSWWTLGLSRSLSVLQVLPRQNRRPLRLPLLARSAVARWSSVPPGGGLMPAAGFGGALSIPSAEALDRNREGRAFALHGKAPFVGAF